MKFNHLKYKTLVILLNLLLLEQVLCSSTFEDKKSGELVELKNTSLPLCPGENSQTSDWLSYNNACMEVLESKFNDLTMILESAHSIRECIESNSQISTYKTELGLLSHLYRTVFSLTSPKPFNVESGTLEVGHDLGLIPSDEEYRESIGSSSLLKMRIEDLPTELLNDANGFLNKVWRESSFTCIRQLVKEFNELGSSRFKSTVFHSPHPGQAVDKSETGRILLIDNEAVNDVGKLFCKKSYLLTIPEDDNEATRFDKYKNKIPPVEPKSKKDKNFGGKQLSVIGFCKVLSGPKEGEKITFAYDYWRTNKSSTDDSLKVQAKKVHFGDGDTPSCHKCHHRGYIPPKTSHLYERVENPELNKLSELMLSGWGNQKPPTWAYKVELRDGHVDFEIAADYRYEGIPFGPKLDKEKRNKILDTIVNDPDLRLSLNPQPADIVANLSPEDQREKDKERLKGLLSLKMNCDGCHQKLIEANSKFGAPVISFDPFFHRHEFDTKSRKFRRKYEYLIDIVKVYVDPFQEVDKTSRKNTAYNSEIFSHPMPPIRGIPIALVKKGENLGTFLTNRNLLKSPEKLEDLEIKGFSHLDLAEIRFLEVLWHSLELEYFGNHEIPPLLLSSAWLSVPNEVFKTTVREHFTQYMYPIIQLEGGFYFSAPYFHYKSKNAGPVIVHYDDLKKSFIEVLLSPLDRKFVLENKVVSKDESLEDFLKKYFPEKIKDFENYMDSKSN